MFEPPFLSGLAFSAKQWGEAISAIQTMLARAAAYEMLLLVRLVGCRLGLLSRRSQNVTGVTLL
jgi:hypothetical protein